MRCSAKPSKMEPLEIADNQNIFTISQQTSSKKKSLRNGKIVSFHNPLAYRTANQANNNILLDEAENSTDIELVKDRRCSISKLKLKYILPILILTTLIIISIALAVYYSKTKTKVFSTGQFSLTHSISTWRNKNKYSFFLSLQGVTKMSDLTSTWSSTAVSTSSLTISPRSTSDSTSLWTSTSTSTFEFLCASAEWDPNGTTIASDLYSPHDVAIDSEGNLIIADTENRRLQKYFNNETTITLVANSKIPGVFIDKFDDIYFIDAFRDEVNKLSSDDGSITTVAGGNGPGFALDQLVLSGNPKIYVDRNATLYVSDTGNDRVMKYYANSTSGIIVAGGHGRGPDSNQLNTPYGIYVDEINEIGAIYICDQFNHRIQKWLAGSVQGTTVASNDDQLHSPNAILLAPTLDKSIIMYISSFYLNQVLKWIPYAEKAETIVAGIGQGVGTDPNQLFAPRGIAFDRNWNLFVADTGNNRIQKFLFNISSCSVNY